MAMRQVYSISFSPTGNTRRLARAAAEELAAALAGKATDISLDLPQDREQDYSFGPEDLVVLAGPTYAGKLPNKIMPFYRDHLHGQTTPALALVTYGNRSFDHSLKELCSLAEANGFRILGAAAFVGEHAFSKQLAGGRPDGADLAEARKLAQAVADKIRRQAYRSVAGDVPGDAAAPYYIPKGLDGQPAKFLKAKPLTHAGLCIQCGRCARNCPMGAISLDDPADVPGTCIKCQRCVRFCPKGAKYFADPAFLSHVAMLESQFTGRQKNVLFI